MALDLHSKSRAISLYNVYYNDNALIPFDHKAECNED